MRDICSRSSQPIHGAEIYPSTPHRYAGGDSVFDPIEMGIALLSKSLSSQRDLSIYYPLTSVPFVARHTGELGIKANTSFHLGETDVIQPGQLTVTTLANELTIAATITHPQLNPYGKVENIPTTIFIHRNRANQLLTRTGYIDDHRIVHYTSEAQEVTQDSPMENFTNLLLEAATITYANAEMSNYAKRKEAVMCVAKQTAGEIIEIIDPATDTNKIAVTLPIQTI